jgi:hypothetical protein
VDAVLLSKGDVIDRWSSRGPVDPKTKTKRKRAPAPRADVVVLEAPAHGRPKVGACPPDFFDETPIAIRIELLETGAPEHIFLAVRIGSHEARHEIRIAAS